MDVARRELEFVGELGRGGFGSVYLANLHGSDRFVRRVAVKVLKPGLLVDPQLIARQRDEARLLGLIAHHAVVQVLDLATVQGRPAVILEYVEGVDAARLLNQLRAEGRALPERAVLEVVSTAASALDAVYNTPAPDTGAPLRVIHRDIKPANLLVTAHGGLKVLDFGVARADRDREGVTGSSFFGTVAYMAPEFWLQEPIGSAYDVYALGVAALELLSGQSPDRAILERKRYDRWLQGRLDALPDVMPASRELLGRLLAFSAADRPSAAQAHEEAAELAARSPTEPLSRLARRLIPPLLAERAARMATDELPSRSELVPGIRSAPGAPTPSDTLDPAGLDEAAAAPRGSGPTPVVAELTPSGAASAPARFGEPAAPGEPSPGPEPAGPAAAAAASVPVEPPTLDIGPPPRPGPRAGLLVGLGLLGAVGLGAAGLLWGAFDPPSDPTDGEVVTTPAADAPPVADAGALGAEPDLPPAGLAAGAEPTATVAAGASPTPAPSSAAPSAATGSPPPTGTSASRATRGTTSAPPSAGAPSTVPTPAAPPPAVPTAAPTTAAPTTAVPASAAPSSAAPTDAAPASPPPASSTARVLRPHWVVSEPMGLAVLFDGVRRCVTPCREVGLADGTHRVEIVLPDRVADWSFVSGEGMANSIRFVAEPEDWSIRVR